MKSQIVAVKDNEVILSAMFGQESQMVKEYNDLMGGAPDGVYALVGSLSDGMSVEIDEVKKTATVKTPEALDFENDRDKKKADLKAAVIALGYDESVVDQFIANNPLGGE